MERIYRQPIPISSTAVRWTGARIGGDSVDVKEGKRHTRDNVQAQVPGFVCGRKGNDPQGNGCAVKSECGFAPVFPVRRLYPNGSDRFHNVRFVQWVECRG